MSEKVPLSPEQEQRLLDAAMADIRGLIKECAQGISDREAEALAIAEPFEDLHEWVIDAFARARPARRAQEAKRRVEEEWQRSQGATITKKRLIDTGQKAKPPDLELKAERVEAEGASFKNPEPQPSDESKSGSATGKAGLGRCGLGQAGRAEAETGAAVGGEASATGVGETGCAG